MPRNFMQAFTLLVALMLMVVHAARPVRTKKPNKLTLLIDEIVHAEYEHMAMGLAVFICIGIFLKFVVFKKAEKKKDD